MKETAPQVSVGIVKANQIHAVLNNVYRMNHQAFSGDITVETDGKQLIWKGRQYDELCFEPETPQATFSIDNVTIGINFHWERKEKQTFCGSLRFIIEDHLVRVVNVLPVETYLESVISSEMSATSGLELLKAHAVISRSWLLAQMQRRQYNDATTHNTGVCNEHQIIKWYDREDHKLFDVCADDHCQRYQGVTKQTCENVVKAVKATKGEVLTYHNEICDTRFSKCCGGAMERFGNCWEPTDKPYLQPLADQEDEHALPDLTDEQTAQTWIRTAPKAFCNTRDVHILAQVLNNYDQETTDFYRWTVLLPQAEIKSLLKTKLNLDLGDIKSLQAVKRGNSGRIVILKIIGTDKSVEIGKELEIRRALSPSHLYSSAFVADPVSPDANGIPAAFKLTGAGWGHGVGLCQIGAAVMGEQGYGYQAILKHYYPGAQLTRSYD